MTTKLEGLDRLQQNASTSSSEAQESPRIVLQVVQINEINPRFSLRLSDGKHFLQVMAAAQLSPLFLGPEPTIRLFDIVQVKEHFVQTSSSIKVSVVLDLEKVESREAIEGSPVYDEEQMQSIKNFKVHPEEEAVLVEKEEDPKAIEEEKKEETESTTAAAADDDQVHPDGSIDFSALSLVQATWVTTEKEIEKRVALISAEMVKQGFINEFVASKMLNYNLKFKNLSASEVFQDAPSFRWKNRRYQRAVYSSSRRAPRAETSSSSSSSSSSSGSSGSSAPKPSEVKREEKPLTTEEFCQQFGLTEEEMNKVTLHHLKLKVTETKSTGQTMITVLGNTFAYKEDLKSIGCRWNRYQQGWSLPWGCQQKLIALLSSLEVRPVMLPHSSSSSAPTEPTPSSPSANVVDPEPKVDPEPAKEESQADPELVKEEPQVDSEPVKEEPQVDPEPAKEEPVKEEPQVDPEPAKEEPQADSESKE